MGKAKEDAEGIGAIRRRNLVALVEQWGGPTNLAARLGHASSSYLSQITGGFRALGEKAARKIEHDAGLPDGWLDRASVVLPAAPIAVNADLLTSVVLALHQHLSRTKVHIDEHKFAQLVATVYEDSIVTGKVDETRLARLVRLVVP